MPQPNVSAAGSIRLAYARARPQDARQDAGTFGEGVRGITTTRRSRRVATPTNLVSAGRRRWRRVFDRRSKAREEGGFGLLQAPAAR